MVAAVAMATTTVAITNSRNRVLKGFHSFSNVLLSDKAHDNIEWGEPHYYYLSSDIYLELNKSTFCL